ncbi:MAG: large subunit ribosomal protein L10e [Thermoplasmata archaeon]|jgi:large subunit ribosomal protein L10e|nr:large subunit ribosomal protein L10e [Thermoplasmata archaeon]
MGGVPGSRITQFDLGDKNGAFNVKVSLVAEERCAIIHNALESARVAANRVLIKNCGSAGYHLKVRVYPHEVLRENKQASGAGADRVSQGMRQSFGKAVGTAARVDVEQPIMTVRVTPERFQFVKEAFRKANTKLPIPTRLVIEEGEEEVKKFIASGIKVKVVAIGSTGEAEAKAAKEAAKAAAGAAAPAEGEAKEGEKAAEGKDAKAPAKGAAPAKADDKAKGGKK